MKKILAMLLLGLLGLEANIKAVGKNFMVTGSFSDGLCVVFIGEQTFFMDENGRFAVRLAPGTGFKTSFTEGLAAIVKKR